MVKDNIKSPDLKSGSTTFAVHWSTYQLHSLTIHIASFVCNTRENPKQMRWVDFWSSTILFYFSNRFFHIYWTFACELFRRTPFFGHSFYLFRYFVCCRCCHRRHPFTHFYLQTNQFIPFTFISILLFCIWIWIYFLFGTLFHISFFKP